MGCSLGVMGRSLGVVGRSLGVMGRLAVNVIIFDHGYHSLHA